MTAPHHASHALIIAVLLAAAGSAAAAEQAGKLDRHGSAEAAAVRDGRTLLLRDGRELRLAGHRDGGRERAQAALRHTGTGKTLTLKRLGPTANDRYGRLVAFALPPDAAQSLQQAMLGAGQARVSARVGDKACADALLASERAAGRQNAGFGPTPISPLCRQTM